MPTKRAAPPVPGSCSHEHANGRPCRATPLRDGRFCFWHDPDKTAEVAEAQRLGGLRRRREKAVAAVYDLAGMRSLADIRRLVDVMTTDALGMENTPARGRLLLGAAATALRLWELGRFEGDGEE